METISQRFFKKIKKTNTCWIWTGFIVNGGYGGIYETNSTKKLRAHRVSYEIHYGPIPKGILVCHKCDNRLCVRPDHLFIGTYRDNHDDMDKKNRRAYGSIVSNKGIKNPSAKIDEKTVIKIRLEYKTGKYTQKKLALKYGLHQAHISDIVNMVVWRHI